MNKIILVATLLVILFAGILFLAESGEQREISEMGGAALYEREPSSKGNSNMPQEASSDEFILCLNEAGVVIYGMAWCPACKQLADSLGGYEIIEPIYVECTDENERCDEEMKSAYVPEIQIRGEIYEGSRSPSDIAATTGCKI